MTDEERETRASGTSKLDYERAGKYAWAVKDGHDSTANLARCYLDAVCTVGALERVLNTITSDADKGRDCEEEGSDDR